MSQKRHTLAYYNFNTHELILIIFLKCCSKSKQSNDASFLGWFSCDEVIILIFCVCWQSNVQCLGEKTQFLGFLFFQVVQKYYLGEVEVGTIYIMISYNDLKLSNYQN